MEGATDCVQFVEYDQRAHRLSTLVTFSFWVQSMLFLSLRNHKLSS